MSESAFEALQEKMKAAAAQMAAIRKEEKKHKQKEEDLIKILLKFIQTSYKKQLVLLISRTLEKDIPANFVIAIILLSNTDLEKEVGTEFMLKAPKTEARATADEHGTVGENGTFDESSLIFFTKEDASMPLKAKILLDNWVKTLMIQAEERPNKLLKNAYEYDEDKNKEINHPLIRLTAYIIDEFAEQHNIDTKDLNLNDFSRFLLTGILTKTQENLDNRKNLGGEVADMT